MALRPRRAQPVILPPAPVSLLASRSSSRGRLGLVPQPFDLVLEMQFLDLQFVDLDVV